MPATLAEPPSLQQTVRNNLTAQGIKVYEIKAILAPLDTGGEMEVWFTGLAPGEKRARRYTAHMRDEDGAEAVLEDLWGVA